MGLVVEGRAVGAVAVVAVVFLVLFLLFAAAARNEEGYPSGYQADDGRLLRGAEAVYTIYGFAAQVFGFIAELLSSLGQLLGFVGEA